MEKLRNTPTFGATLRALRKAAGLTQEQVAIQLQLRGLDVSRSVYSQFECGVYNIRSEELAALRQIFGVSYDAFFAAYEHE